MSKGGLLSSGLVMVAAQIAATAAQFLFNVYASRALSAADYGAVGALGGFYMIVAVPLAALHLQTAYHVSGLLLARKPERLREYLRGRWWTLGIWSTAGLFLALLTTPLLQSAFRIESPLPVILMLVVLWGTVLSKVAHGAAQGFQQFGLFAMFVAGPPMTRLFLAIGFPPTLSWIMAAFALAALAEVAFGAWVVRRDSEHPPEESVAPVEPLTLGLVQIGVAQLCFAVLANADMLLVRYLFPDGASGAYSVAVQINRGITFFPIAIAHVLFPQVSKQSILEQDTRPFLAKCLGVTCLLVAGFSLPCLIAPEFLVERVFHSQYGEAVPLLRMVGLVAAPLACCNILVHYLIAAKSPYLLWVFVPTTAGVCGALAMFGTTPLRMFAALGASGFACFAVLGLVAMTQNPARTRES